MACSWISHQYLCHLWRSLPKLGGSSLQIVGRKNSTTTCHFPLCVQGRHFSASVNIKEICEQPDDQEFLESCESSSDGESTGVTLFFETNKTEDIPDTLDKNLNSTGLKLANGRLLLIDGTTALYRAYYQLVGPQITYTQAINT